MAERDIIFRGKRIDNLQWTKGCLIYTLEKDRYYIIDRELGVTFDIIPHTRGQFTSFLDKNNEELYEDDVVIIPSGYGGDTKYEASIGVIKYENGFYVDSVNMSDFEWCDLVKIKTIHDDRY